MQMAREKMKTKFAIELPYVMDFCLKHALQKAMRKYWEESLMMASSPYYKSLKMASSHYYNQNTDEIYWQENIDITADMILQIMKQEKKK